MPIARIEPTGCGEFHGNVKVRLALYLEPDDARYNERHYLVPIIPSEGYPGEVNPNGSPTNQADYNLWIESLPKKWVLAPFHNHFLYLPPDVTEAVIIAKANFHLPNFYAAWLQELDKINGGMRRGWDVATRARPIRYDKTDPELYKLRKQQCLDKVALIKELPLAVKSDKEGEIFPSTEIDIGADAIDRASYWTHDWTVIALDNPANDTGTIDSIEIWADSGLANTKVGTFSGSGTDYTSRDVETIGTVASGSKQTFTGLDIDVTSGDYIGVYYTVGGIETDFSGFAGLYSKSGDQFGAGQQTYALGAGDTISLYGTGETPPGLENKSANMGAKLIAGKLI